MRAVIKMLALLAAVAAPTALAGSLRDVDHYEKSGSSYKCKDYKCDDGWSKKDCYKCSHDDCCEKKDYDYYKDSKDDYKDSKDSKDSKEKKGKH